MRTTPLLNAVQHPRGPGPTPPPVKSKCYAAGGRPTPQTRGPELALPFSGPTVHFYPDRGSALPHAAPIQSSKHASIQR
jgi:hypothetical protein